MICTCTLNPSLDLYMQFDETIQAGEKNVSRSEYYEAGGKGINVSIVLNNLQIPTRATGFVGGFTREYFITLLQKYTYIQPNFTYITGNTRINVKMADGKEETDLNAAGPNITKDDMQKLAAKISRLGEGDYFVLAGNCPEELEDDVVEMLKEAIAEGVKVCLDTNETIEEKILGDHPFMVQKEIGPGYTIDDAINEAKAVHEAGAVLSIVITDDFKEAVMVCDQGMYRCDILGDENVVNTVGTGNALMAGCIMNSLRSRDPVDSFRYGCCCASATAYSRGLATKDHVDERYETTEVRQIDEGDDRQ